MRVRVALATALLAALAGGCFRADPPPLESSLGRSEVRLWAAPYPLSAGRTLRELGIPERLERLGYERVRDKPTEPGEFFWGEEVFWVYRRAHRWDGRDWPELLPRYEALYTGRAYLSASETEPVRATVRALARERSRPRRPTIEPRAEPEQLALAV